MHTQRYITCEAFLARNIKFRGWAVVEEAELSSGGMSGSRQLSGGREHGGLRQKHICRIKGTLTARTVKVVIVI